MKLSLQIFVLMSFCLSACIDERTETKFEPHAFYSPQGIAVSKAYIIVANSGFHFDANGYQAFRDGSISFVDRITHQVVSQIKTSKKNPQALIVQDDVLYVLNGGVVSFGKGSAAEVIEPGSLDIINLDRSSIPNSIDNTIELSLSKSDKRIGSYGSMVIKNGLAFIGSGTRGDVFVVSVNDKKVLRGAEQPVEVFKTEEGRNDISTVVSLGDKLGILSFSKDKLCVADPTIEGILAASCKDIGKEKDLIEGPIDALRLEDGSILIAMSLANDLYRYGIDGSLDTNYLKSAVTPIAPNRLRFFGDKVYLLASGTNHLIEIDAKSGEANPHFSVFGAGTNPFDFALIEEESRAWISLWKTHQIAEVDLRTGKILVVLDGDEEKKDIEDSGIEANEAIDSNLCADDPVIGIEGIESLFLGKGGGFGKDKLPAIIQGGPEATSQAAVEGVLSLGIDGEIVVSFGKYEIVDGPGDDFIIFENSFLTAPYQSYAEPALVSLSQDGKTFDAFPCDQSIIQGNADTNEWAYPGCAGVIPVNPVSSCQQSVIDSQSGGDRFDLATIKMPSARYMKIRDLGLSMMGESTKGFDLDAVVLINYRELN